MWPETAWHDGRPAQPEFEGGDIGPRIWESHHDSRISLRPHMSDGILLFDFVGHIGTLFSNTRLDGQGRRG